MLTAEQWAEKFNKDTGSIIPFLNEYVQETVDAIKEGDIDSVIKAQVQKWCWIGDFIGHKEVFNTKYIGHLFEYTMPDYWRKFVISANYLDILSEKNEIINTVIFNRNPIPVKVLNESRVHRYTGNT